MKQVGLLLLGKKGLISLSTLEKEGLLRKVRFAVIAEDTSVQNDYSDELIKFCELNGIRGIYRQEFSEGKFSCDLLVAIGWRWLVNIDEYRLITIHDSLLPKYRGFNPLVTALIEGDKNIGATAILANEKVDAGDIISQKSIKIEYPIKIEEAIEQVAHLYGKIVVKIFQSDALDPKPQDHSNATYSIWRNEDDYKIDWTWDSERIVRFIDAVGYPYLGALTNYKGKDIRILQANVVQDLNIVNRTPGKLFRIERNHPMIICGAGMVQIYRAVSDKEGKEVNFDKLRVCLK